MPHITPTLDDEAWKDEKEVFDFNSPEDVLISVIKDDISTTQNHDWKGFSIDVCTIIDCTEGVTGAASYEASYGGFLDYTIEGMIDCPKQEGWFVVVGVTGVYTRGDGWQTDDDMDFYFETVRPATPDEIALA